MWVLILGLIIDGVWRGIALDVRIEPIQNSPGLYYQHETQARLYSSKWKVVTYLRVLDFRPNKMNNQSYRSYGFSRPVRDVVNKSPREQYELAVQNFVPQNPGRKGWHVTPGQAPIQHQTHRTT
jgi:hypothetical protein